MDGPVVAVGSCVFSLSFFAAGLQLPYGSNQSTDPEQGFKWGVRPVSPQSLLVQTEAITTAGAV